MKQVFLALALFLCGPVTAQTTADPSVPAEEVGKGFSLMEEGAKLLFKGLMSEMEPALDEMGQALSGLEPALKDLQPKMLELLAIVDDLTNYQPPERLENGDILIRRKPGAPAAPPLPKSAPENAPAPGPEPIPQTDL